MKFSFNIGSSRTVKQAKPLKKWQQVLIGVLFTFIGGFLLVFSVNQIKDYKEKDKTYKPISATVVAYDTNSDGLQAVIVEYAVGTTIYREKSDVYSNLPKQMGTKVDLKYNPNNPEEIIWVGDSTNYILPLTSVIFIVCGFLICIGSFKKKEEATVSSIEYSAPTGQELPPSAKAQMVNPQSAEPTVTQASSPVETTSQAVVQPQMEQSVVIGQNPQENVENPTSNINN